MFYHLFAPIHRKKSHYSTDLLIPQSSLAFCWNIREHKSLFYEDAKVMILIICTFYELLTKGYKKYLYIKRILVYIL